MNELGAVKPGDKVIVHQRFASRGVVRTVSRMTKSQLFIEGATSGTDIAYWRASGNRVGADKWGAPSWMTPWTQEAEDAINDANTRAAVIAALRRVALGDVPTSTLVSVLQQLKDAGAREDRG